MLRDILLVALWVFAVWVCVYDWEDVRERYLAETESPERSEAPQTPPNGPNGNKLPRNRPKNDFQNGEDKL